MDHSLFGQIGQHIETNGARGLEYVLRAALDHATVTEVNTALRCIMAQAGIPVNNGEHAPLDQLPGRDIEAERARERLSDIYA